MGIQTVEDIYVVEGVVLGALFCRSILIMAVVNAFLSGEAS
jgi:hypothetical protein